MLTKFNSEQANWKAITYDDFEYYWSDSEYEVYKKATENADLKILHFKDGSLAIADVRRVESYIAPKSVWEENNLINEESLESGADYLERIKKL